MVDDPQSSGSWNAKLVYLSKQMDRPFWNRETPKSWPVCMDPMTWVLYACMLKKQCCYHFKVSQRSQAIHDRANVNCRFSMAAFSTSERKKRSKGDRCTYYFSTVGPSLVSVWNVKFILGERLSCLSHWNRLLNLLSWRSCFLTLKSTSTCKCCSLMEV